jgi:ribonuclease G
VNLELYQDPVELFEKYQVNKEIEKTFQKKVHLKCGGHLVIEQTEALVSIDVNTGKFTGKRNLEETVLRTNLESAKEVARQLRLRDMGGVIIVDFIDMELYESRKNVIKAFREAVKQDRAKTNILSISEIGMVEMTRQRIRPSLESAVYDTCSYCEGKGVVKSVSTMAIETFRKIRRTLQGVRHKTLEVSVNSEVATRILSQDRSLLQNLEKLNKSKIILLADSTLHREDIQIRFVN